MFLYRRQCRRRNLFLPRRRVEVGVGIGVAFEAALVPTLEVVAVSCLDEALLEDFLISFACSFSLGACAFSFALSSFPSASASFIGVVLVLAVGVYFALPFRFVTMAGKEGFGFSFSFFLESWGGCGGFLGTSAGAVGGGLIGAAVAVETDPGGASATSYIAVLVGALPWAREVVEVDGNAGNSASSLIRWRRIGASSPSNNTCGRMEPSCACNDAWCNTRPYRGRSMRDRQGYCNTVGHGGWWL